MKNLAILILFTWGLITSFGQSVPRVNTVPVVATNNGPHLVTATGSTIGRTTQDRFNDEKNVLDWGLVGDGVTENDTAFETMIGTVGSKAKIVFPNPKGTNVFLFDSVNISNDVRIVGTGFPTIKHKGNSSGHMWNFLTEQKHSIEGLYFDGNAANQNSTTNFYSLLYIKPDGLKIQQNTFSDFVRAAILNFTGPGDLHVQNNKFYNGMQIDTNAALSSAAVIFAPGVTNTKPYLFFTGNVLTNSSTKTGRYSGGIYTAAADSSGSLNQPFIYGNFMNYVGDNTGPSGAGIAPVDVYEDNANAIVKNNIITNSYFTGIKFQNTQNGLVEGNSVHTFSTQAIGLQQGERSQTNSYYNTIVRNNFLFGNGTTTYGIYLSPGDSGTNIANVLIDGNFITNCIRGINLLGFNSAGAGGQIPNFGPVRIVNNFIAVTNNNAIMGIGTRGDIDILNNTIINQGAGAGITFLETNSTTNLRIYGNTISAASYGVRVWGVNSLVAGGNTVSGGVSSVDLQDDAAGNDIQKLYWHKDNIIRAGSVAITAADIVTGFFGNGNDITWYPNEHVETTTGAAASYFRELHFDQADRSFLFRLRNDDPAGAAVMSLRAGGSSDVVGQFSAYATNYSDADKAGRLLFAAENAAGTSGISIEAPYTNKSVRIRAGDSTTRFAVNYGGAQFPQLTANRVLILDGNQNAAISSADTNDLNYISTVTSDVQTQLNNKQPLDSDLTTIANNNPGNSYYFGTDSGGTKGFYTFPGAATHTNTVTIACSDLTTALTAGNGKAYWRAPFNCTVVDVRASLLTASSSGAVTIDVNEGGASIFTTTLTIDASETTSTSAATPAVIGGAGPGLDNDDEITIDIDGEGTNAAGLLVTIYYVRTS